MVSHLCARVGSVAHARTINKLPAANLSTQIQADDDYHYRFRVARNRSLRQSRARLRSPSALTKHTLLPVLCPIGAQTTCQTLECLRRPLVRFVLPNRAYRLVARACKRFCVALRRSPQRKTIADRRSLLKRQKISHSNRAQPPLELSLCVCARARELNSWQVCARVLCSSFGPVCALFERTRNQTRTRTQTSNRCAASAQLCKRTLACARPLSKRSIGWPLAERIEHTHRPAN